MKAAVIYEYGGPEVFQMAELPEPEINADDVLVKVYAASVNPVDWKQRKGNHRLFLKARFPIVLGYDISGEVVKTGAGAKDFQPGDQVYTRLKRKFGGAFAEYAAAREDLLAHKPGNIDHLSAAGVPLACLTALQALRDKGRISAGKKVLIIGASGGVGHFALQLARYYRAPVTAVCSSRHNKMMEDLAPDRHLDYQLGSYRNEKILYDIIFDVAGVESFLSCRKILNRKGIYITSLPRPKLLAHKLFSLFSPGKRVRTLLMKPLRKDLDFITGLIENNQIKVYVDSVFPLEDVAGAHRKAEEYHTEGKIIIKIAEHAG